MNCGRLPTTERTFIGRQPRAALKHRPVGADASRVSRWATAWDLAPSVLAAAGLAAVLFARAFLELRRRGRRDHAGWTHAWPFFIGLALLTLALVSPLDAAAEDLLSAHML